MVKDRSGGVKAVGAIYTGVIAVTLKTCSHCGNTIEKEGSTPFMGKPSRSALARDKELGDFVMACAGSGTQTLKEVRQLCVERYGEMRTPSRMAIHRFIQAVAKGKRPPAVRERKI